MKTRIAIAVAIAGLCTILAVFFVRQSSREVEQKNEGLERLPLVSYTQSAFDNAIVLTAAALPMPCEKDRDTVTFCVPPSNLTMTRSRYEYFRRVWGQRGSPASRFLLMWQAGPSEWRLILSPEDHERPLAWFEPDVSATIRLWPVFPSLVRMQTTDNASYDVIADGPQSLRIRFPNDRVGRLRRWTLEWIDKQTLSVKFVPQTGAPRILIDPGHGGTDTGAFHENLKESELNLQLAIKVEEAIRARGMSADLTRRADQMVPLAERFGTAFSSKYDLVLSIHNDWYPGPVPWQRPGCFYGRQDVEGLCRSLVEANPGEARSAAERRFLLLTTGYQIPSVLVEKLNLFDPQDRQLASARDQFQAEAGRWASAVAERIEESFRNASEDE